MGVLQALTDNDISVREYLTSASATVSTANDDTHLTDEIGVTLARGPLSFSLGYTGSVSQHEKSHALSGLLRLRF